MYEIGVVAQFEAAHRLKGDFGPATRLHGHTYRVEVTVRGPQLKPNGSLCDLGVLKSSVDDTVGALHYQNLDDLDAFADQNSTVDVLARHLADAIRPRLKDGGLSALSVRVWESPQVFAGYETDLKRTE